MSIELKEENAKLKEENAKLKEMLEAIRNDVAEVKHAHWEIKYHTINHNDMIINGKYPTCTLCGYAECGLNQKTAYCPNCGAKMDGDGKVEGGK